MRRSFKMATAFTGVTAIAGAFGPAALAAPAFHSGNIHNQECGANNDGVSKWVHLYYPMDDHPAECFASEGQVTTNVTLSSFCPGNNNGVRFIGTNPWSIPFHAGSGRNGWDATMTSLDISNWSGNAKCT